MLVRFGVPAALLVVALSCTPEGPGPLTCEGGRVLVADACVCPEGTVDVAGTCTAPTPASCGATPHLGTEERSCFQSASVAPGQSCVATEQTRTCHDGAFDPDWPACEHLSCEVRSAVCGDSAIEGAEECDDGNASTELCAYGQASCTVCDASCQERPGTTTFCGDGVPQLEDGEACDEGASPSGECGYGETGCEVCTASCQLQAGTATYCGDGVVRRGYEGCEDGTLCADLNPGFTDGAVGCGSCRKVGFGGCTGAVATWFDEAQSGAIPGFSGGGTFRPVDVDGDGDTDLLGLDNDGALVWVKNEGGLTAHSTGRSFASSGTKLRVGDVDGDGQRDLIVADRDRVEWIAYGSGGSPAFTSHPIATHSSNTALAVGDLDGDGDLDVVLESSGQLSWRANLGAGASWSSVRSITVGVSALGQSWSETLQAEDLDADGDVDLVGGATSSASSGSSRRGISFYENDGSGAFTERTIELGLYSDDPSFFSNWSLRTGDLDGDGDLDLIFAARTYYASSFKWFRNEGGGDFSPQSLTSQSSGAWWSDPADLDLDGDLDIVLVRYLSNGGVVSVDELSWWENLNGDGSTWTSHVVTLDADTRRQAFAMDVDVDGDSELIGYDLGPLRFLDNQGICPAGFTSAVCGP